MMDDEDYLEEEEEEPCAQCGEVHAIYALNREGYCMDCEHLLSSGVILERVIQHGTLPRKEETHP